MINAEINSKKNKWFLFYISMALFGYSIIAPLSELLNSGSETSLLTLSYRLIILTIALGYIYRTLFHKNRIYLDNLGRCIFVLMLIFWFIFSIRIGFDTIFNFRYLEENTSEQYLIIAYFYLIIPMLSMVRNYNFDDLRCFYLFSLYILLFGVSMSMALAIYQMLNDLSFWGTRLAIERLNPISLGMYSAILFILALGLLKTSTNKILLVPVFIGLLGVVMSGSRGAFVSLIVVLAINFFSKLSFKRVLVHGVMITFVASLVFYVMSLLVQDFDIVANYLAMGGDNDQSAMIRFELYKGALLQFGNNPIFGDLLIERTHKFYPHNHILEILMATGLVGFFVYFGINLFSLIKLSYMKKNCRSGEYSVLFHCLVFLFVAGQFSGSIFGASEYWLLLVILCFCQKNILEHN